MVNITFSPIVSGTLKASRLQPSDDVYCFDLMLGEGRLSGANFFKQRREVYKFMFGQEFDITDADMGMRVDASGKNFRAVMARLSDDAPVRIWTGNKVDESCGCLWMCSQLAESGYSGELHMMDAPPIEREANRPEALRGWAYFDPEDYVRLQYVENTISGSCLNNFANKWTRLQEENSLLRGIAGEGVASMPSDYFDAAILALVPDENVKLSSIVERSLAGPLKHHSDLVCSWRLNELIRKGMVEVAEEHPNPMKRIIRKSC